VDAPTSVPQLIERFHQERDYLKAASTKEHLIRKAYIDPLFSALGWDLDYSKQGPLVYREVVEEDALRVEGAMKAPDYAFRIGGQRKFFVEAKKPSVNLQDGHAAAFQVRRYGWSARLPLSILTDFEEFAVYDCRVQPDPGDQSSTARTTFMGYEEYPDRWEEIADLFSREAVLSGSLEAFEQEKPRRGTSPVDQAFLAEIDGWRELLAKEIYRKNQWVSRRDLNYAVQITIDRIVFLRICEDRGIEDYGRLEELLKAENIYKSLCQVFRNADDRYNSGLFHFREETDREESPDGLTLELEVEDKPLKRIIRRLYYPQSPYQFSVMPVEILGQVYEQFLGKVITITPRHSAVIEEKPEVRKAGGVYYTPAYIVDHIVEHTVGKLVEGKTPRQVSRLKLVDPACGSGSFLIGAYDYLLDWHRQWYVEDGPEKHRKVLYTGPGGEWRLINEEKKRILKNHIFGVDIDPQAVEVTKLSLLLKVLEGETDQTITRQLAGMQERALPDLDDNIKCGNSLIGPDFYNKTQMSFLDEEEEYRINVFPWQETFPQVFKGQSPGFDAVIGNPPYIRIQALKEFAPIEVEYYKEAYRTAARGNYDIYVAFVEKGLSLLRRGGRLGFILPHKFFNAQYGRPLRTLVSEGHYLEEVIHFGHQQVFSGASTYTCLLFLNKAGEKQFRFIKVNDLLEWRVKREAVEGNLPSEVVTPDDWNFVVGRGANLFNTLSQMSVKLGDIAHLFVGLQTDADDVFIVEERRREDGRVLCWSRATGDHHWFEDDHIKPFLKGSLNIKRYQLSNVNKRLIFPYEVLDGKSVLLGAEQYQQLHPLTWAYLELNRDRLASRNKGKMGGEWYGYVYKKNHTRFTIPKLLVPSIATGSSFAPDLDGRYYFVGSGGGGGGGYGLTLTEGSMDEYLYLLGLLNSRLMSTFVKMISTPYRGGYIALNRQYIEHLPIRTIDFTNPNDKALHDQVIALVEKMIELHQRLSAVRSPTDRNFLQRQINATDHQIDLLVYELYGLTDEEVEIVERG
jgi:type I restriction-modification system DNA methylase subunit